MDFSRTKCRRAGADVTLNLDVMILNVNRDAQVTSAPRRKVEVREDSRLRGVPRGNMRVPEVIETAQ